jgi:hypothetical protein
VVKIFIVLLNVAILTGCASTQGCKKIKNRLDRMFCEQADTRWQHESGWRYTKSYVREGIHE